MSDDNLPSGYICTNCKTTFSFLSIPAIPYPEDEYCPVCGEYWFPIDRSWHRNKEEIQCTGMYADIGEDGPNWKVEIEVCGGCTPTEPPLEIRGMKIEIVEK
jgi:hypothetical protein